MPIELDDVYREFGPWAEESLINEGIRDVEIKMTGVSEKGDNYMGDVIFLEANGKDGKGEDKTIHLVIKKGKPSKGPNEEWDRVPFYLRENTMYDTIFPAFRQYQLEKNIEEPFDSVPKCYNTIGNEKVQAILMENLKKNGYELHDRFVTMNSEHIKFVLYNYAKFHAVSFAMRDQDPNRFKELTKDLTYVFGKILKTDQMKNWYDANTEKTVKLLEEIDPKIAKKFQKKSEKSLLERMIELGEVEVEESVVTHGDCWNNNFMFKYEDSSKKSPSKVAILDWQLSTVHSPAMDLSYFLYIVSAMKETSQFEEYLRYYHENLSESIRDLGSDPEKLFPFSTLMEHWRKYSCYGLSFLITSLEVMTCEKEDAPDVDEMGESQSTDDIMKFMQDIRPKNYELFKERFLSGLKDYCAS